MKKNFFAGIMTACILGTVAVTATVSQASNLTYKLGDCNDDGYIDSNDALLVLEAYAKTSSDQDAGLTDIQFKASDVNQDKRVDSVDASIILSYYAYISTNSGTILLSDYINKSFKQNIITTTSTTPATTSKSTTSTTIVTPSIENVATIIKLNGTSISVNGKNAVVNGSNVSISHSGTYIIEGKLDDGQILVDIPDIQVDPDTVKLVLNGVNITGKSASAILVKNANNTFITIGDETENIISDSETAYTGENLSSAVIEAKDDITFKGGDNGTGFLTINANVQPAVVSNNDIKITGGNININTLNNADGN